MDTVGRAAPAGVGGSRALPGVCNACDADSSRLLLRRVPAVCLFVRPEEEAIRLYERIGMRRALLYRSPLF